MWLPVWGRDRSGARRDGRGRGGAPARGSSRSRRDSRPRPGGPRLRRRASARGGRSETGRSSSAASPAPCRGSASGRTAPRPRRRRSASAMSAALAGGSERRRRRSGSSGRRRASCAPPPGNTSCPGWTPAPPGRQPRRSCNRSPSTDRMTVMATKGIPTEVLVAPDGFKGTLRSAEVARSVARGIERGGRRAAVCPLADGGEGTLAVLAAALGLELVNAEVRDPLGRPVQAQFGLGADRIAVVEMAAASGLSLVEPGRRDAVAAGTEGTGELIVEAVAAGARTVYVAVGGSATTDGGAGALRVIRAAGGAPSPARPRLLARPARRADDRGGGWPRWRVVGRARRAARSGQRVRPRRARVRRAHASRAGGRDGRGPPRPPEFRRQARLRGGYAGAAVRRAVPRGRRRARPRPLQPADPRSPGRARGGYRRRARGGRHGSRAASVSQAAGSGPWGSLRLAGE